MDNHRFDRFVRAMATASTRRRLLQGLAGLVVGGAGASFHSIGGEAAVCRGPGRLCREAANCCAHSYCGNGPHRRCTCDPAFTACGSVCVDLLADVANCGSCGHLCPDEPCNTTICASGVCDTVPDPLQDGLACDDGDLCTGGDVCQSGVCAGDPVDCSGFVDACHTSVCDPNSGNCLTQTLADDTVCVSANPCDVDPTCQAGICTPVSTLLCLVCHECSGNACVPVADGTSCGQNAVCVNGGCQLIQCLACSHLEGISCVADADGTPCGQNAYCVNGGCQVIQCLVCNHVEGIACVPDNNGTPCGQNLVCENGGCVPV